MSDPSTAAEGSPAASNDPGSAGASPRGARDRLFRGYGPLIGFTAVFLAIAVLVPSQQREVRVDPGSAAGVEVAGVTEDLAAVDPGVAVTDPGAPVTDPGAVEQGSGGAGPDAGGGAGSGGGPGGGLGSGPGGGPGAGPAAIAGCGPQQVPGDPYSPVCVRFSGGNGGETSRGVTGDSITVAVRIEGFSNGLLDAVSRVANAKIPNESPELIRRTVEGLVEYFNKRFQFYGRKMKLVVYNGKGDVLKEITGGGQEGAQADALKVSQEIKAFADVSAVSPVYADALSSKGVINVGAPYTSREWMSQRRPFAWSQFPDCSTIAESVASYFVIKMAGKPAALAGGNLRNQPRRAAIIAPENSWYQECVRSGVGIAERAGKANDIVLNSKYVIDIPKMSSQADTLIRQLKDKQVTSVICTCDPLIMTFMTAKAREQGYEPEWLVSGVALVDNDLIGQILQQDQWGRSFGISFAGAPQPAGQGLGYRAYKSTRSDEPSIGVELIYNQIYLIALGIQGAGPNLTPQSFEQGMFNYPRRSGPFGTWGFGPGDYTTAEDAREVFWNPSVNSPQTRSPGTYQDPNGGARFPIGKWPGSPPRSAKG
ncbi:MAG: hypothetical protein ACKO5A_06180 [Actinomycetota bacterium]